MYDSFLLSGSTIHHDMQPLQPRKGIERVVGLHECHFKGRCWFKIKMLERKDKRRKTIEMGEGSSTNVS